MDRAVIATATELFACRHYPGVVAVCTDALDTEPECVELLVIRARSHIALRRDLDAQADLRDIIRLAPSCGVAYRLLGELAARRDENDSAAIFFREALRLDPDDHEARDWLQIVGSSLRPAAVAKLPAPVAAAGRLPLAGPPLPPARTDAPPARFASGTHPPDPQDERPTKPFSRGSQRDGAIWKTPTPAQLPTMLAPQQPTRIAPTPLPLPPPPNHSAKEPVPRITLPGRPPMSRPPTSRPSTPMTRATMPELPGFGDYLVSSGILTRERLRAAQAYQRSMKVQLATAIVTLGLASPQRIEWASVAHQSELSRARQP